MLKRILQLILLVFLVVPSFGQSLGDIAKSTQGYVEQKRNRFHMYPELRWKEEDTLMSIEASIRSILFENPRMENRVKIWSLKGGLVVDYSVGKGEAILFRADIDGLPVTEQTRHQFSSHNKGVMHACGHDTHVAMLLSAIKVILEGKVKPTTNLRFAFQRAEENPIDLSGGASLVQEGVLEGVSAVYGLHIWANAKPGEFLSRPGPFMANSDRINIKVRATGGHVAMPHRGSNAIDIATDIHVALRGLDRRVLGAVEPCALIPAVSNSGSASNVRPAEADIWYAARNYLDEGRRSAFAYVIRKRIEAILWQYPDAKLTTFNYVTGHPATINSPESFEHASGLLRKAGQMVVVAEPELGGDDFAYYLQKRPGSYWLLGANKPGAGDHHSETFDIDERELWRGILF